MHLTPPADELVAIRTEIARLRRREAELRAAFLTRPDLPTVGRWHKVEVVTQRSQVFDPRLLPDEIRLDPGYTREKVSRVLRSSRRTAEERGPAIALPDLAGALRTLPRARLFTRFSLT